MAEFAEVMKQKERMCWDGTFNQRNCPLYREVNEEKCDVDLCNKWIDKHPQEAEEIIMKWAKEHPIETNADKFKEVFGIDVYSDFGFLRNGCNAFTCKQNYTNVDCSKCKYKNFWHQEYKEPKGAEE